MYLDKSKVTIKGKTYSRCLLRRPSARTAIIASREF